MPSTRWIFIRAYILVALLVVITGVGLEKLLESREIENLLKRETALMQGNFLLAEQLQQRTPGLSPSELSHGVTELTGLPATILPLADFSSLGAHHPQLQLGTTIILFDDEDQAIFYRRLADSGRVLALGPIPAVDNERAQWVVPLFYCLLALAVFLWVRPLWRDLGGLQRSAHAFGEQDFSARVSIPTSSWLSPLGHAFNSMAQRIQWLLQSHRDLTHAVSHELRTPLARIRFSLEILATGDPETQARHRDSIDRDVEELNTLIEEMLSYAELDQENLQAKLEPLDIEAWTETYVANYHCLDQSIELITPSLAASSTVLADARLLARALDNLVGNALRYAGSRIEIRAEYNDGVCQLQVLDDGPGIPEDQRDSLLTAFTRLPTDKGEVSSGFGLGLAIVKRIMDLHQGEIIIGSSPSGGARMTLRWPG